jgi:hypothetical protein
VPAVTSRFEMDADDPTAPPKDAALDALTLTLRGVKSESRELVKATEPAADTKEVSEPNITAFI